VAGNRPDRPGLPAAWVALAIGVAAVFLAGTAYASFSTSVSNGASISSGQLVAPTGLAAAHGTCNTLVNDSVNLSWTATTATIADGYEIFRGTANGGPYSSIGTVSGLNTTTYTDSGRPFLTTYYYVVQAKRNNWRSANSGQASITTRTNVCV